MKVKVISLPYIFQVLYVLRFTRPRNQVSVYRTIDPLVFKVMDVEELELKIAIVGLLWSFLQNERQRRHVAKLRPGRNIVQGPIVRSGGRQHQRWLVITIAIWKRIATGRQRLLQKFLADGARNV